MEAELKQLWELADKQVQITHHFDSKFSKTAFTLLQKTQGAFLGTGSIVKKFINDMATAGLNFICDTTVYEAELSASDGMAFVAELSNIWGRIAELIREAEGLEFTYEEVQKDFTCILEWVGKEVKEYLDKQSVADCMIYMDESFNVSSFVPVVVGMAITHHSLLTSLWVNVSHIPLKILLSPLTFNTMAVSEQDGTPQLHGSTGREASTAETHASKSGSNHQV